MLNVVTLEDWKAKQEEIVVVTDHKDVANRAITVFTDIQKVIFWLNFDPILLDIEPDRFPGGFTFSYSKSLLSLELSSRFSNHQIKEFSEVIVWNEQVGRASVENCVLKMFKSEATIPRIASKRNTL